MITKFKLFENNDPDYVEEIFDLLSDSLDSIDVLYSYLTDEEQKIYDSNFSDVTKSIEKFKSTIKTNWEKDKKIKDFNL